MLPLVPGGANAKNRPPSGQDVESGDDLRQQTGVTVGDAGDEKLQLDR